MQEKKEEKEKTLEDILDQVKDYLDDYRAYVRLYVLEKASRIFADLVTNTAVIVCFILAFLFGTFTLALFLSDVLGSYTRGFGCVALIYAILALVVYLARDKYIERFLADFAIKKYFDKIRDKEEEDEQESK